MLLLIALTRRRSFFWKNSKVESLAEELIKSGQPIPPMLTLSIFFLSETQKKVYRQKPQAIEDLVQCAKDYAASYDQETIKRVARNV